VQADRAELLKCMTVGVAFTICDGISRDGLIKYSVGSIPAVPAAAKVICEEWRSVRRGRRAVSPWIHAGSNDAAFRWLSQLGGIVRGSFQETVPRKTAENTIKVQW